MTAENKTRGNEAKNSIGNGRGNARVARPVLLLASLALIVGLAGCQKAASVPAVQAQAVVAASPEVQVVKAKHLCEAKTKAGTACKNHVKAEGEHCHLHQCGGDADCEKKFGY